MLPTLCAQLNSPPAPGQGQLSAVPVHSLLAAWGSLSSLLTTCSRSRSQEMGSPGWKRSLSGAVWLVLAKEVVGVSTTCQLSSWVWFWGDVGELKADLCSEAGQGTDCEHS